MGSRRNILNDLGYFQQKNNYHSLFEEEGAGGVGGEGERSTKTKD